MRRELLNNRLRDCTLSQLTEEHVAALMEAFRAVSDMKEDSRAATPPKVRAALDECRMFLDAQVPCGSGTHPMQLFIARVNWRHDPLLRQLFRDYIQAGAIDPNATLDKGSGTLAEVRPLEAAVAVGTLCAFDALLEAGADPDATLSRDWSDVGTAGPSSTLDDLIDKLVKIDDRALEMKAMLREARMRRLVDRAEGVRTAQRGDDARERRRSF